MNIEEAWQRALEKTEIVRARVLPLDVKTTTPLPYIFLAESAVNMGDTVVRKGEVMVEPPSIVLPSDSPQFFGFDSEGEMPWNEQMVTNFLLVRGVRFPSFKYNNKISSLDIHEGKLSQAIGKYSEELQRTENTSTGLVVGPEECWQFSALIFICSQVMRSAEGDLRELLNKFRKKQGE